MNGYKNAVEVLLKRNLGKGISYGIKLTKIEIDLFKVKKKFSYQTAIKSEFDFLSVKKTKFLGILLRL